VKQDTGSQFSANLTTGDYVLDIFSGQVHTSPMLGPVYFLTKFKNFIFYLPPSAQFSFEALGFGMAGHIKYLPSSCNIASTVHLWI